MTILQIIIVLGIILLIWGTYDLGKDHYHIGPIRELVHAIVIVAWILIIILVMWFGISHIDWNYKIDMMPILGSINGVLGIIVLFFGLNIIKSKDKMTNFLYLVIAIQVITIITMIILK